MMVGFQCQSALFGYEISMMVDFFPLNGLNGLQDFNEGRFPESVGFVPLLFYEILKTVDFVTLQDFNEVQFWSVLLGHEISMTEGFLCKLVFILLRDFKYSRFCFNRIFQ